MSDRSPSITQYWTSYKRGTVFFPSVLRAETQLLYAFVREADEYVDSNQRDHHHAQQELDTMQQSFHDAYAGRPTGRALTDEFAQLCHQRSIETEWVDAFFSAMYTDTTPRSYQTYTELQQYMYGSAEVIWLMMCQLIGYTNSQQQEVHKTAKFLGEAMQYTNFLRDIKEDREELGRIYIPQDLLSQHNLSHSLLQQYLVDKKPIDSHREKFMQSEIARIRTLYTEANKWITHLHTRWRIGVYLASRLYAGILSKIEQNKYDVFGQDAHTSSRDKAIIWTKSLLTYPFFIRS